MYPFQSKSCTAFAGTDRVASGDPRIVARTAKKLVDAGDERILLIFDDATAEPVEMDLRGSLQKVLAKLSVDYTGTVESVTSRAPRPGRPKLGVVSREVTLLPRHWDWLNAQPGGASVALRRLVEEARRVNKDRDRIRSSREVTFRFLTAMAGNEPGFEEANRALFAGDRQRFEEHTTAWPKDVREYAASLAADAFPGESS